MNRKLRVLLLVAEPWRCDDGGGNTLDNFLEGIDAEFAQIYTSNQMPQNNRCSRYYQMTDSGAVCSFLSRKEFGHVLDENSWMQHDDAASEETVESRKSLVDSLKSIKLPILYLCKDIVWFHSNWKTEKLKRFILDFEPDVIYAPCYNQAFYLELTRWVKDLTHKRVVTWSADDTYSLRQFSISPFYWIRRFWARRCLRQTYPYYDVFFSASEDEAEFLEPIVKKKIEILRKGTNVAEKFENREVHTPIRMVYAGGLYNDRWKTLAHISSALKKINEQGQKIVLDIYTASEISPRMRKSLYAGGSVILHGCVSKSTLNEIYHNSDIAIHCESFGLKQKLATRLSFSTKIIDCLESGCAVLAIAWKEQTGYKYLKENDAAICVDDYGEIEKTIRLIADNPQMIPEYAEKAYICAKSNTRELTTAKLNSAFQKTLA